MKLDRAQSELIERTAGGLHSFLEKKLPTLATQSKILDVGCGSGAWLQRLKKAGFLDIYGIDKDVDQFALDPGLAKKVNLDWEAFPFASASFDFVTTIEVVEHIENIGFFLDQIQRVLKPGGHFLITTPNTQSLIARLRFFITGKLKSFDEIAEPTHVTPIFLHPFKKILLRHSLGLDTIFLYPEDVIRITSRSSTRFLGKCLRALLPDPFPGDVLCLLGRKTNDHENKPL